MDASRARAGQILGTLLSDRRSAMYFRAPKGALRGLDFYSATSLVTVLARAMLRYERKYGVPLSPPEEAALLSEKITWSKFFRPLPIPTPADKLKAFSMLPVEAAALVGRAEVVWQSSEPQLPPNTAVTPGDYFLKPNHASGLFELVSFPLQEDARALLEAKCADWLRLSYGLDTGEWWYSTIAPMVFLERALDIPVDRPAELKFHMVGGKAVQLHVYRRLPDSETTSIYDGNLRFCDISYQRRKNPRFDLPAKAPELLAVAERLAQGLDYVRVDLFLDQKGDAYFGELTFAPSDGRGIYSSRKFEAQVCRDWDIRRYLYFQTP